MHRLRQWYSQHCRDLPWRSPDTTPWGILVSEVMLQQTPVSRVVPAWLAWMAKWPTASDLARAPLAEVLIQWDRMGYPRRAKNLHEAARQIVTEHQGKVPRSLEELLALPGVGAYTARAVACFAFGQPHPVVDTNVKRVVARATEGVAGAGHWSVNEGLERVNQVVDHPVSDADYCLSQRALMELGALVCQARTPRCEECPLSNECRWKKAGFPVNEAVLPRKQAPYEGSDRQARGVILAFLRDHPGMFPESVLVELWPGRGQILRALRSLVHDGLVVEVDTSDEPQFGLSGSSSPDPGE